MDSKEKWNLIVKEYYQYQNEREDTLQKRWEVYSSELLGYKRILNEIDSQRKIFIGSKERLIPDIILCKDNKDVVDIELKRYSCEFDKKFEEQLISYLKQLQLSIGIIICKKIYIYVYNYLNNDYKKLNIDFVKDSAMGQEFIEIFSRDNFDKNKIEEFVNFKNKTEKNIEDIKKQIDKNLVLDCLKNYFCEQYTSDEIEEAIKCFNINVTTKAENVFKCARCHLNSVEKEGDICSSCRVGNPPPKDGTKYLFNGIVYGKNRLVLAVVNDYVNKHQPITYEELKTIFPDNLQGSKGVIVNEQIFKSKIDNKNRYFCKNSEIIQLDEKVYVCNQWGANLNIERFVERARLLGYEIIALGNDVL